MPIRIGVPELLFVLGVVCIISIGLLIGITIIIMKYFKK
jgi:hypothetical protein